MDACSLSVLLSLVIYRRPYRPVPVLKTSCSTLAHGFRRDRHPYMASLLVWLQGLLAELPPQHAGKQCLHPVRALSAAGKRGVYKRDNRHTGSVIRIVGFNRGESDPSLRHVGPHLPGYTTPRPAASRGTAASHASSSSPVRSSSSFRPQPVWLARLTQALRASSGLRTKNSHTPSAAGGNPSDPVLQWPLVKPRTGSQTC